MKLESSRLAIAFAATGHFIVHVLIALYVTVVLVPAPQNAAGGQSWRKMAGLLAGGAILAACILGVAFYLRQQGMF